MFAFILLLVFVLQIATATKSSISDVSIENELIRLRFDKTHGSIVELVDLSTQENLADIKVSYGGSRPQLWTLTFVDANGLCTTGPQGQVTVSSESDESLALTWRGVSITSNSSVVAAVDVTLTVSLANMARYSKWQLSFEVSYGLPVGIWEASIGVPLTVGANDEGVLFYPGGYGYLMNTNNDYKETYPGGQATMQFMAVGSSASTSAAYVSALDGTGLSKQILFESWGGATLNAHNTLGYRIYPQGAGLPIKTFSNPYAIAVGVISNVQPEKGRPLWYEAAVLYRDWAMSEAQWTKNGPIRTTTASKLPSWYRSNSIWINTHWACLDVFNSTGGDPDTVMDIVPQIAKRLNEPSLSLHWYEWQQGAAGATEEDRYKFDTHYPDYFPPRNNYLDVNRKLFENYNVATFPYINGRIYDVNSISYANENGNLYCSKKAAAKLIADDNMNMNMESYTETYGNNATFCVANPFTPYWQKKVSDVVDSLVNDWEVNGVYIDQIGSAIPKLCWDKHHHHTLGGGNFWREGYLAMMNEIASVTTKGAEKRRLAGQKRSLLQGDGIISPMVTEDNAEAYLDMMQGVLTLVAFRSHPTQSSSYTEILKGNDFKLLAPAFPVVYGGYYTGFGAEWFRADFEDHDWWCAKLSAGFLSGSQMGWFSLIGTNPNPEDNCGPMGVGDLLLSSDADDLVQFMGKLSKIRANPSVLPYIIDGRIARPLVMNPTPPTKQQTVSSGGRPILTYDAVSSQSWETFDHKSILVMFTSNVNESFQTTVTVDPTLWNFPSTTAFSVKQIVSDKPSIDLGMLKPGKYDLQINMPGRDIMAIEFTPVV